ncbi:acyl-CoA dehydrogenase family protein [Geminocystis sp. NIES-3708]|uniref:nucleoside triphosphate pyrophosphohydrolase n=1 Tax=Geminocystis sp. NIES-3708 TaxID=1615909 RepID=UPI0005FCAB25|nr:nucleoside triphosphate pyrophosphohydrolase [Geminocystis sp. NIES-3708]BAQ62513.1 acyl-CoA dehydrogenase family protein [Geminocystis sp. NIES-3708]
MNEYQKLIRDKIPQIINSTNKKCQVKRLSNSEYKQALKYKLIEESKEVFFANPDDLSEEIADIYEVIETLIKTYKLNKKDILKKQKEKQKLKGKFNKKYLLLSIDSLETKTQSLTILEQNILKQGRFFLEEEVLLTANIIDRDSNILKETFLKMNQANASFFQLKLSSNYGGVEISNLGFYSWQIMITKYSGALSFLQAQHQSAISMLNKSTNKIIKEKYLQKIILNNQFCGVGFSHLRRQGKPLLIANPTEKGYELTGVVPWITGYNIFAYFIIGAVLPDGRELYGVVPFQNYDNLTFSVPMKLSAMNSTNTVTATLNHWFLSSEDVVMINPHQSIHQKDQENILHHGFFALGCSFAGLRVIKNNYQKINLSNIKESYLKLKTETENLQQKMLDVVISPHDNFEEKLNLRIQAISLAYRCAIAAIVSSKGESNQEYHDANRIYREALVYSVSGQTTSVLNRSLETLMI